jgi:hypothetical protein
MDRGFSQLEVSVVKSSFILVLEYTTVCGEITPSNSMVSQSTTVLERSSSSKFCGAMIEFF